jgi:hypothetical protein
MTIPNMNQQKFIDFLKENGCKVVSDENWDDYNRVMFEKDGVSFPLQMQKTYYYYTVCKICEDIGIIPPEEHKRVLDQIRNRNK